MKKILIVMGRYLPGYRDGGPVRTIKNLVDTLGMEYDFHILTLDRDRGDSEAYSDVKIGQWNRIGNAQVYYAPREKFTPGLVKSLAKEMELIYVCGCFDFYARHVMNLKRKREISAEVVIASMGLFSPGAYRIKKWKKSVYVGIMKMIGNFKGITWSATSEDEVRDIRRVIGKGAKCHVAQDLPRYVQVEKMDKEKEKWSVKIIFLSRISPKKNLLYAIDAVAELKGDVVFDIYGPEEDEKYWELCKSHISKLPDNIICTYKGMVDSERVIEVFKEYHVFLFPTLGENYGHVIFEALAGGCMPVISDQTPWRNLDECGVGYVRSLRDVKGFICLLQEIIELDESDFEEKTRNIYDYVKKMRDDNCGVDGYKNIFV